MKTANRTKWSDNEKRLVALNAERIVQRQPNISFAKLFTEAQQVLPENRQRKVAGEHAVPWLRIEMHKIRTGGAELKQEPVVEVKSKVVSEPQVPSAIVTEEVVLESNLFAVAIANQMMKELPDILVQKLADTIMDQLADRVLERLGQRLLGGAALATPVVQHHFVQPLPAVRTGLAVAPVEPEPKPVKGKVLLLGINDTTRRDLDKEFGELLELSYWKREGFETLKVLTKESDLIIVATSPDHRISSQAKFIVDAHKCRGAKLRNIHTAVVRPREILEHYYVDGV